MKTAVILDIDNLQDHEINLALTFFTRGTTFFAVGLAPLDLVYKNGNSLIHCNKNKFQKLGQQFHFNRKQLVIIPNNVAMAESSDIKIAQVMGRCIAGSFDQCIVVSNDHSMFMLAIMMKQIMPIWIMITRPQHGTIFQKTNARMKGVPVIRAKKFPSVSVRSFVQEI